MLLLVTIGSLLVAWPAPGTGSTAALDASHVTQPAHLLSGSPEYGLDFISSADAPADEARYQRGISTGASWNRWPLYWYHVETSPGDFYWSYGDAVVSADLAHGFQTELILMGTPGFYSTASGRSADGPLPLVGQRPDDWWDPARQPAPASPASPPTGLFNWVFNDDTDVPGAGKGINPSNPWARFVFQVVSHYVPMGITHYEIWNEQDYLFFWSSTPADYARLLKVAYLAAEQAAPSAQIIFGGLANFQQPGFLADVMAVYAADPMGPTYNWFFDILATHSYSYAWESWYHVWRAGRTLANHGVSKPVWLNESGTPAWNDYPGPTWDPNSGYRSTVQEGAAYVIQSALYAQYAGATAVFHFQLYDDCGNDPQGTDFPPYYPGICDQYNPCAGDAFGLFRNRPDASCYTQHPSPDTPRPVFDAYRVLTQRLQGLEAFWRLRPGGSDPVNGPQEWIAFYRPATGERVLALWARFGSPETAIVTATSNSGTLIDHAGTATTVTPTSGQYTLALGPATNQNLPHAPGVYAIGGPPLILIETDTMPPATSLSVPAPVAPTSFWVSWSAEDLGFRYSQL